MQKMRYYNRYNSPALRINAVGAQRGVTIQLILSYLVVGAVALSLSAWLEQLHVLPFTAWLIALAIATLCGLLCTLNLQYSLYLLELALARLAHDQPLSKQNEQHTTLSFVRRWPLGSLFLSVQEIERRVQHYRTHERLTNDVREQALQQARESAALAERNRIARDLHDSIKQHIFGISASAAAAEAYWQRENMEEVRAAMEDIQRSTQGAQVEMQALLQQLRPAPLENTSLLEALRIQAQALEYRTGAYVELDLDALPAQERLLPGTQEAIFRLIQEAFANIARHARAQTVLLSLRTIGEELRITVRDDGQGFDPAHADNGMGLSNLRERTEALHGSVTISSQPGQGTTVAITIPLLDALPDPAEEARQRYELERAEELSRRSYQLSANAIFLGTALGWVGIVNGWWNTFLSLSVLATLLVTLTGLGRGWYYRVRVISSSGRGSRVAIELAQGQYRAILGLLLPASLGVLYLFRLVGYLSTTATPALGLFIALALGFGGPVQFLLWRYTQGMERYYRLLSPQEVGRELERRQQWFVRALIVWSILCVVGLIFAHALFVLPPVTPAQQNAFGMALILLVGGLSTVWSYRLIKYLKQLLRQYADEQVAQTKEE